MRTFRQISGSLPWIALVSVSASIAVPVSAAPALQILRGSGQETAYGSAFAEPLTVWVTDSLTHRPIAGTRVNFMPGRGLGVSPSYAITNEKGVASVTATGLEVCTTEASAQIAGEAESRVNFSNLQVDKASLTIVPDDIVSPTGSEIPAFANYSLVGFVNGDNADTAHISGNPTLTTTASNPGLHANYVIKGNPGTLTAPNYTFVVGYGTLAIVGGAASDGWISGKEAVETASTASDDAPSVRPAMAAQHDTDSQEMPAFIAGLHGDSGVFVKAAIWSDSTPSHIVIHSQNTRSALLVNLPASPQVSSAPVRKAELPDMAAAEPTASAVPLRTVAALTVPQRSTFVPAQSVPVRSAMFPGQTNATPVSSAFSGTSIRKAFVSPAGK